MVGLKRRKKVEGWALDVSETDAQVGRATLRQRLAENNRLWSICLLAVIVLTASFVWRAGNEPPPDEKYLIEPAGDQAGSPDDPAHREFARKFAGDQSGKVNVVEARFTGPDIFRITVSGNTSRDDIDFLAKVAGIKIVKEFHFRPVVQVYTKSAGSDPVLAATAQWETKKYGFVVKSGKPRLRE